MRKVLIALLCIFGMTISCTKAQTKVEEPTQVSSISKNDAQIINVSKDLEVTDVQVDETARAVWVTTKERWTGNHEPTSTKYELDRTKSAIVIHYE